MEHLNIRQFFQRARTASPNSHPSNDIAAVKDIIDEAWEVFWVERDGRIRFISKSFFELTGYESHPYVGKRRKFYRLLRTISAGILDPAKPIGGLPLQILTKSGESRYVRSRLIRAADGTLIGILEDITREHLDREQLEFLVDHDELTETLNRRGFERALSAMTASDSTGVMILNVDRLKEVNDAYGHHFGDAILKEFAKRLKNILPMSSALGRLGSDEFAVALPLDPRDSRVLEALANRILASSRTPFIIEGTEVISGMSIGYSRSPEDGSTTDELMTHADLAMNQAKMRGKSQTAAYHLCMSEELLRKLNLSRELAHALEKDEIRIVYQPQWDLNTQALVGLEALLRWNHPVLGAISPQEFIPLAETNHMIHILGEYVLWQACGQMQEWASLYGTRIKIAVNVSPLQLLNPNFETTIRRVLIDTELPPELLELEMTESCLMENTPRTIEIFENLRGMGISLSLDDFGTEYASFNYLQQFRMHKLKVDKLFVQRFLENSNTENIVRTIIQLGKNLDMRVLAEGVETEQQARELKLMGCQEVQGFYFAYPMETDSLGELIGQSSIENIR